MRSSPDIVPKRISVAKDKIKEAEKKKEKKNNFNIKKLN